MDLDTGVRIVYLIAAVTFIVGLKGLGSPSTAQLGNRVAAGGMLLAVTATFVGRQLDLPIVAAGLITGTVAGVAGARLVKMTAMPQMVALFNGAGGGAATLVAILEYWHAIDPRTGQGFDQADGTLLSILFGTIIGAISFSGSAVAFAKLQGVIPARAFHYPFQRSVTALVFGAMLVIALLLLAGARVGVSTAPPLALIALLTLSALAFGVALVLPIGGADMPVVISLLNAYTGLAVAAAGFVLDNQLLIVSGTLVGASGTILTRLMSKAMNRSLKNVLFGAFGSVPAAGAPGARVEDGRTTRPTTVEDVATLLAYARSVIIVPGFGLAVAQAQHAVRELADVLGSRGVKVVYAIHPVAGRMPGHMNVLLAEANVPYESLLDLEAVNPEFARADVALVIGANDVTNPAARSTTGSPISGMPILDVDKAANVIVIKRSMKPGFAGIDNELYLDPKTAMLFGDAKDVLARLISEVKAA